MKKNVLITGRPRTGKTTLIKYFAEILKDHAGGFYTEEIRGKGVRGRKGFRLITLSGHSGVLAEVDFSSTYNIGRYGVHLEVMEKLAVPAVEEAIKNKQWIIIDEIGKMEEGSLAFKKILLKALNSSKRLLATIRLNDDKFTRDIKDRSDISLIFLNVLNREKIYRELEKLIKNCL